MYDDDRMDVMAWINSSAEQIIREMLDRYGIDVDDIQPQTPFQGQVIDSTAIVLDETQRMLPAPVHYSTTPCCRIMDNDEPL